MSPEHLIVPESNEVVKKKNSTIVGSMSEAHRTHMKELPMSKSGAISTKYTIGLSEV